MNTVTFYPSNPNPIAVTLLALFSYYSLIDDQYFKDYPETLEDGKKPHWYICDGIYDDNNNLIYKLSDTQLITKDANHDDIHYVISPTPNLQNVLHTINAIIQQRTDIASDGEVIDEIQNLINTFL